MKPVKKLLIIQASNAMLGGALGAVVPLLMKSKGISTEQIGLIASLNPAIFQSSRILMASISDMIGRVPFLGLSGVLSALALMVYHVATSRKEFATGILLDSLRNSSLWAVNRPFVLEHTKEARSSLAGVIGTTMIFSSLGSLLAGIISTRLSLDTTLLFFLPLSAAVILTSLTMKEIMGKRRVSLRAILSGLNPLRKDKEFQKLIAGYVLAGFAVGTGLSYVMPLYYSSKGLSASQVGVAMSIQSMTSGMLTYFITTRLGSRMFLSLAGVIYFSSFLLLGLSPTPPLILPIFAGIASSIFNGTNETLLSIFPEKGSYGADVALLMLGLHSGNTIAQAIAGFIVVRAGFLPVFLISASAYFSFTVIAYLLARKHMKS
ncbi:MAG TPA: MFS transporter [Candidatus Korarchaeota archaeon]|nr:MFS transporter [Candidatus Korarchaeota archaeon]